MAEEKNKTIQTSEEELNEIIEDLIETQAVSGLAHSVAEENAGGERPWCYIEAGLKLTHDRLETAILRIQDIRDSKEK
jgi:hypothetical protein